MSGRPFTLSVIARQISRGHQEEDDDDYEGGTEGDGAEAANCAVGIARTRRGDDYGGDEGGLFCWGSVVRHFWGWWDSVRA